MRPVTRGAAPPGTTTYEEMRPTLLARLGRYCSYCEFPVQHGPHAEHIIPKDLYEAHRDDWCNLLVACSYCNGHKGKTRPAPHAVDEYLWPTRDNTARAFHYRDVIPQVDSTLARPHQALAARTRGLVQLGLPDDERARRRAAAHQLAQRYLHRLPTSPDRTLAEDAVVDLAVASGFFSVWMEVFAAHPAIRRRLIDAFPGTAQDCYDAHALPQPRPGGRV